MQASGLLGTTLVRLVELHQHRCIADFAVGSVDGHAEAPAVNPKRFLERVQRERIRSTHGQVKVDGVLYFRSVRFPLVIFLTTDFGANDLGQVRMDVRS